MKPPFELKQIYLKIIDWFLVEPKRLVRLVVLSICSVLVFFQLWECAMKLLHPPISTQSHFDLNQTMFYPAVTICREPGFKIDVMNEYNLSYHPFLTSSWMNFSFDTSTVSQLYEDSTYTRDDFFSSYTLDGDRNNIEVISSLHFSLGRCFTLQPKKSTLLPWKKSGYSVSLKHDLQTIDDSDDVVNPPGFHVYLHEPRETFTEYGILSTGRIEYLFMDVNEELELKLTVQHFTQLRGRGSSCSDDLSKSSSVCSEKCRWKAVEDSVGCSGPWMIQSELPECSSYHQMKNMIHSYMYSTNDDTSMCSCVEPCYSIIYSSFVMKRTKLRQAIPNSRLFIYYTSKMVTNIEERPGYDSSQFVADMGGSVGFLLGLSVIGLIVVLEKLLGIMFMNKFIERYKEKQKKKLEDDESTEKPQI